MRPSRIISLAAALLCGAAAWGAPPARVVSLNLCTDQMALLLGAPGQVVSLSRLAHDPRNSVLAEEAAALPLNDGSAEAVVLLRPDLVLAGSFTTRATVDLLRRLGYRVESFAPAASLDEARANLLRMGTLLGREAEAQALVARFDARLAALSDTPRRRPRAVFYMPWGEVAGRHSMAGDILAAAGLDNLAEERGLAAYGGRISMEELVLDHPDLILIGRPYGGQSQLTDALRHPALRATGALRELANGARWTCETPALLDAVADMRALRLDWEAAQ